MTYNRLKKVTLTATASINIVSFNIIIGNNIGFSSVTLSFTNKTRHKIFSSTFGLNFF